MNLKHIFFFVMFTQLLIANDPMKQTGEFPLKEMQTQNQKIVKLVVDELSKDLPKAIDAYTTFVDIQANGSTLVYTFEINTGSKSDESVQKEDKQRMQEAVTRGVCRSSKRFLDAQINISYVYISKKTQTKLFEFNITQQKCLEIKN